MNLGIRIRLTMVKEEETGDAEQVEEVDGGGLEGPNKNSKEGVN